MKNFKLTQAVQILERTPAVLSALLSGIDHEWINCNEGQDTWSPFDVVGHLIHGERTDYIDRLKILLSESGDKKFTPFNRFAQFEESRGKNISQLLEEFKHARMCNLTHLSSIEITEETLKRTGVHPVFGSVTLHELLATWVAHDLDHIMQIVRVMAKRYSDDAGPWVQYLRILH